MIYTKLSRLLGFDYTNQQDWAIEFADYKRIGEFINVAIDAELNDEEKIAIVELILASFDDYLNYYSDEENIWISIANLLDKDQILHSDILNYWALFNSSDSNDVFAITPFVRAYLTDRNL
jgi:hypothetical protein